MIFIHEDFVLDLNNPNKGRLYKNDHLVFIGDGYRAITMLLRNVKNPEPVQKHFSAQLNTRQKSKFSKVDNK